MGDGPDVSRDTVMLTYGELADRLGIDVQSARRRALRHRWPKTKGNDGRARVAVPETVLATAGVTVAATHATLPTTVLPTPPVGVAVTPELLSRLLSQMDELGELRERLGRAEGERDAAQAEAAALRADVARLREAMVAERERANAALERAAQAEGRLAAGSPTVRAVKAWRAFLVRRKGP